jgi:cell division protein FtsL
MNQQSGISNRGVIRILLFVSFVLLLTLPNIYLDNAIYHKSREITKYEAMLSSLKNEQEDIKQKLEFSKFNNTILNTMDEEKLPPREDMLERSVPVLELNSSQTSEINITLEQNSTK